MRNAEDDLKVCEAVPAAPWGIAASEAFGIYGIETNQQLVEMVGWEDDEAVEPMCNFICVAREALPYWINRAMAAEKATQPTP